VSVTTRKPVGYGYVRVSTAGQADDGHSIECQKSMVSKYMADHLPMGTSDGGIFIDKTTGDRSGVSGRVPFARRPAGGELAARVRTGDHVVMLDIARGFRSFRDAVATLEDWIERGVTVHLVRDKITTGTAPGRLYIRLMAQFAQAEREMIAERTREVMQFRKAQGRAAGAPGLGQRYDGPKGQKRLVWDDREVDAMHQVVRLHEEEGKTFDQIWLAFMAAGILTGKGKKWSRPRIYRAYLAAKSPGFPAPATPGSSAS